MVNWKQELALVIFLVLLLPNALLAAVVKQPEEALPEVTQPSTAPTEAPERRITLLQAGGAAELTETEYLAGVVLKELPASFQPEAKKAQAVVARTYALRVSMPRHGGAVCGDSGCCQGYISPEAYLAAGGSEEAVAQAFAAAEQTRDLVLTYEGELIEATYFSCSGGRTEAAVAVWGSDVPYLQSVESPGEEAASVFTNSLSFTKKEFAAALSIEKLPSDFLGAVTYTAGGGVDTLQVAGKTFTGTQLRKLLGLRSTAFSITAVGNSVVITTRGYGHRVGMSQYGANAMAAEGVGFAEILRHYYPGTALQTWPEE